MKKLFHRPKNYHIVLVGVFLAALLLGFGVSYVVRSNATQGHLSRQNCSGTCVDLRADEASPDTIAVATGTYVQFNSADGKSHNISIGKGGEEHDHHGKFHSGEFQADEAWRVQFNEDGSFYVHDHLNPKINVLIVVYTPGKDYKIQR